MKEFSDEERDIEIFNDCFNRLKNIGNEDLCLFTKTLFDGNLNMIEILFRKYFDKYKQANDNLGKEYELGAAQACYENDEGWRELLKEERAKCLENAGSYDIDRATINQHKYIGGFEAISRILKDI